MDQRAAVKSLVIFLYCIPKKLIQAEGKKRKQDEIEAKNLLLSGTEPFTKVEEGDVTQEGAQIEESPCHLVLKPMTRKEICYAEPHEMYFLIRKLLWNQRPPFHGWRASASPIRIPVLASRRNNG
jgi:hypothetical protein